MKRSPKKSVRTTTRCGNRRTKSPRVPPPARSSCRRDRTTPFPNPRSSPTDCGTHCNRGQNCRRADAGRRGGRSAEKEWALLPVTVDAFVGGDCVNQGFGPRRVAVRAGDFSVAPFEGEVRGVVVEPVRPPVTLRIVARAAIRDAIGSGELPTVLVLVAGGAGGGRSAKIWSARAVEGK